MSKTVDQRVVEMQFDNKNFERNVSTTMSTLDKLKEKLNFTGSAKGLENVGAAASKINMGGLASGVELVHSRFSALEVMGVTALANITNSAVNAGKRITKALTIDPVKSGFNEYELKMGSIQTIMASTGESLETVNQYLDELNKYSDQTIYSFQDMTQNIGKFTNAGVKLEDAVMAIKGISNEAAVSGANANEASRAMYNFAQALSAGYVKLIDWKSIENANMATVEFKNQLIETAVELETVAEASDGMYKTLSGNVFNATKNFNEVFQDEWMTSEVLIETLKKYASETTVIGKKASEAATEVKTFSMMMDTLKESLQSGWARTWEIIVGDFEQGKTLWTNMSKTLGGLADKIADARNTLLDGALNGRGGGSIDTSLWEKLEEQISKTGVSIDDFQNGLIETAEEHGIAVKDMIKKEKSFVKTLNNGWLTKDIFIKTLGKFTEGLDGVSKSTEATTEHLEYFQKIFDEVWAGRWGNGVERMEKLAEAGHDYAAVQDLINKHTAGYKLTLEDLSDEQLKSVGYTDEQIKAFRELAEEAEKTGTPINELIESMTKPTGRELILDSFRHILEELQKPLNAVKEAWGTVFGDGLSAPDLYSTIEQFHDFAKSIEITTETAGKLETVFEGLFYGGRLLKSVMGTSLVAMLNLASAVLKLFGTNMLDLSAHIAEYIIAFGKWVEGHTLYIDMMNKVAEIIHAVIDGVDRCVRAFLGLDAIKGLISDVGNSLAKFFGSMGEGFDGISVDNFVKNISEFFTSIETWIKSLNDSENLSQDLADGITKAFLALPDTLVKIVDTIRTQLIAGFNSIPMDIIMGLAEGLWNGVGIIGQAIMALAQSLIEKACDVLGINSPSKVFFAIGGFIIAGLIQGLMAGDPELKAKVEGVVAKLKEAFQNLDWGAVLVGGFGAASLYVTNNLLKILNKLVSPIDNVGKMFGSIKKFFDNLGESIDKFVDTAKWKLAAMALKDLAIAIAILVGSVALLAILDSKGVSFVGAFSIITGLAAVLGGLAFVIGKWGPKKTIQLTKFGLALAGMSVALLILTGAIALIKGVNIDDLARSVVAIGFLGTIMAGLIYSTKWFDKDADKVGGTLIKMSVAILMMTWVIKLISGMKTEELIKGMGAIVAFGAILAGLTAMSHLFDKNSIKLGGSLIKISVAILMLIYIANLISSMKTEDLLKGGIAIAAFGGIMLGLMYAATLFKKDIGNIGNALFKMSAAILMLVLISKLVATMTPKEMAKGVVVVGAFGLIVMGLVAVTSLVSEKELKRVGTTVLTLSVAIAVLAGVAALVGLVKLESLAKGIVAVGLLSTLIIAMVKATEHAKDVKGTLVGLAITIGALAATLIALTFLVKYDLKNTIVAVGVLSALMGSLSILVKSTKSLNGVTKIIPTLLSLAVVTGILATIVFGLTLFTDPKDAMGSAAALSMLLLSLSASMMLIGKAGALVDGAIVNAAKMGLVVAELGVILAVLSYVPNIDTALKTATALSILLLSMAIAMDIISYTAPTVSTSIWALAGMGLVVAELRVILGAMAAFDIEPSIKTATALSILLIAMSGALVILGAVGAMGFTPYNGILALMALIAGVGLLITKIGEMATEDEKLEQFLNTGIPLLEKIGRALGSFFGNIIAGFGEGMTSGLPAMAENLRDFVSTLGEINPDAMEGVKALAGALLTLTAADLVDRIASWITGGSGNHLAEFGGQIAGLAEPLKTFADNLGSFTPEQLEGVKNAALALEAMANAASKVDGQADWSKAVFGDNSLVKFATQMRNFILSMSQVGEFPAEKLEAIKNASKALDVMADAANKVDGQADWSKAVFGDNSLPKFATQMRLFILSMSQVGEFPAEKLEAIKNASKALDIMADAANKVDGQSKWSKDVFGDNSLTAFAKDIKNFVTTLSDLDMVVITKFSITLNKLGSSTVKEFIEGFKKADSDVKDGAEDLVDTFIDATEDEYSSMKSAGKYLVEGFAKGISNNSSIAKAAARAVAKAAAQAAEDALDINSPSKVGVGIGNFFGLGFVNGIESYVDNAYSTASDMASSARDGLNKTVSKIKNVLELGDIDTQPTISPVLDLTNIRAGANTIGNLLTAGGPVDVLANVRSANMMMNQRNQNGMNDDVISAINALRGELGNLNNTTYQINGVTYDDGSNITDAVRTIVRYAKIGGRV